jgi:hypothetical protein
MLQGVDEVFEFKDIQPSLLKSHFKHRFLFIGRKINEVWLKSDVIKCMISLTLN